MVKEYSKECWRELWNPESRAWQYIDRIAFILLPLISLAFAITSKAFEESKGWEIMVANLAWIIPLSIWLLVLLVVIPYRVAHKYKQQRDEARNMVEQQREPSDSEVNDAIQILEAETLVVKNNEGEECLYPFAQVFLAIANQLSTGISLNYFEGQIRKGLGIDERGEWYFPYEEGGITRLIGVLDQYALVDRSNEEYQRMVGGLNYAYTNIVLGQPKEHLSKGTETKYYLSLLGRRVIRQLRKQLTSHKGGPQN